MDKKEEYQNKENEIKTSDNQEENGKENGNGQNINEDESNNYWYEFFMELLYMLKNGSLTDKEFMDKIDNWVKEISSRKRLIEEQKNTIEKYKTDQWQIAVKRAFWGRIILSSVSLVLIGLFGYWGTFKEATLAVLFTGIVASIFIQPKYDKT